jgi:DNA-binding MarR family transcriptional regulator
MPDRTATRAEASLAEAVIAFARALRGRHAELLASHGLHPGQDALLLMVLATPGLRQADLAARLGVEPPTVTRMVKRLERSGLLERRRDPDDARAVRIHPTPRSRMLEMMVRRSWSELDAELLATLGAADAERLRRLVTEATRQWTA